VTDHAVRALERSVPLRRLDEKNAESHRSRRKIEVITTEIHQEEICIRGVHRIISTRKVNLLGLTERIRPHAGLEGCLLQRQREGLRKGYRAECVNEIVTKNRHGHHHPVPQDGSRRRVAVPT
jgi:hypothetical protein